MHLHMNSDCRGAKKACANHAHSVRTAAFLLKSFFTRKDTLVLFPFLVTFEPVNGFSFSFVWTEAGFTVMGAQGNQNVEAPNSNKKKVMTIFVLISYTNWKYKLTSRDFRETIVSVKSVDSVSPLRRPHSPLNPALCELRAVSRHSIFVQFNLLPSRVPASQSCFAKWEGC
jgi:hypothetical protein